MRRCDARAEGNLEVLQSKCQFLPRIIATSSGSVDLDLLYVHILTLRDCAIDDLLGRFWDLSVLDGLDIFSLGMFLRAHIVGFRSSTSST